MRTLLVKILLPLLILAAAGIVAVRLISTRSVPERIVRETPGVLVETMTVHRRDQAVTIRATGTVRAAREAAIVSQVAGRVDFVADNMVAGGFFRRGELMFAIEDADYQLALERAEAEIARAELELARMQSNAQIAREEWELFGSAEEHPAHPLTLFEPQLKSARAAVDAARAGRDQARLNLERTKISAPFNCRVRSENIAPGLFVHSGTAVAQVADVDSAEIILPVRFEELDWLSVPRRSAAPAGQPPGATALISAPGKSDPVWTGRVIRSLGEIDPGTRMASLVVAVDDPYDLSAGEEKGRELPSGLFVEAALQGRTLENVIVLPRHALRDGDTVWVAEEETLRIRPVDVLRTENSDVFIGAGLETGQEIILTAVSGAAEGMAVRRVEGGATR